MLVGLPTETWQSQGSFINEQFHLGMDGYLIKAAAAGCQFQLTLQLQYCQHLSDHMQLWDKREPKARSPGGSQLITPFFSPGMSVSLLPLLEASL